MTRSPTTIYGAIAAATGALSQVQGLPPRIQTAAVAVAAISVALMGFFAADAKPTPVLPVTTGLIVLAIAALLVATGCTLGGFGLDVSSPTFGSVTLDIGHGTIGSSTNISGYSRTRGTNYTTYVVSNTNTINPTGAICTNGVCPIPITTTNK
jgi:hypothetical protein